MAGRKLSLLLFLAKARTPQSDCSKSYLHFIAPSDSEQQGYAFVCESQPLTTFRSHGLPTRCPACRAQIQFKCKQDALVEAVIYTKKQTRKLIHAAFKAGLINIYHARPSNDLSGQNSRLYALKRLFPKIFTERQPGHVTRKQEKAARAVASEGIDSRYVN